MQVEAILHKYGVDLHSAPAPRTTGWAIQYHFLYGSDESFNYCHSPLGVRQIIPEFRRYCQLDYYSSKRKSTSKKRKAGQISLSGMLPARSAKVQGWKWNRSIPHQRENITELGAMDTEAWKIGSTT